MKSLNSRRIIVVLGMSVALVSLVAGVTAYRAQANTSSTHFSALFDSTVGLYPGSSVEILGVPVGKVTKVTPAGKTVSVEMLLDSGQSAAADTKAVIVAPTLVSDRYVQLTEPYSGGAKLANDTVIPRINTAVPIELDALYGSLDDLATRLGPKGANKNGALSDLLKVGAANLDGNGKKINRMIDDAGRASNTLAKSGDDLFATVESLNSFTAMLAERDGGVADFNDQLAEVSGYLADDRDELAKAVANLGEALAIVDDFVRDSRGHLKTSVDNLIGPSQILVEQKESLEQMVRLVPLTLQNFINAYDAGDNVLDGRVNLNELTIWANGGTSGSSPGSAPLLLPDLQENR